MRDVASVTKEVLAENSYPKAKVDALCGNEGGVASTVPILRPTSKEVVQNQSSEDKASPVVGPPTEPLLGSSVLEGVRKTMHQLAVKIATSSLPISSHSPVTPIPQSTPPETMQVKRQGRKTLTRAEAPRRRGKKQGPVLPAVDASIGQDPNLNPLSQNKSRDSLGNRAMSLRSKQENDPKELTNVTQVHTFYSLINIITCYYVIS